MNEIIKKNTQHYCSQRDSDVCNSDDFFAQYEIVRNYASTLNVFFL